MGGRWAGKGDPGRVRVRYHLHPRAVGTLGEALRNPMERKPGPAHPWELTVQHSCTLAGGRVLGGGGVAPRELEALAPWGRV